MTKRFLAKTFKHYEEIERELLEQGFVLYLIDGKLMKYINDEKATAPQKTEIFMSFWN